MHSRRQSPVKALSGGECNRLLLARLFTRPANVLVLDEPTNDLDLETLELLEAERDALRLRTTGPEFYKETANAIRVALARLEAIDPELAKAYDRWNALDARA